MTKSNTRNAPPSNRQLLILLGMFVGFVLGVICLVAWLVDSLVWLIPPSVEQQLGALVVSVYEQRSVPTPAQVTLNQLLDRLEANLPPQQTHRDYQVLYIPESTVNALAIPGDRIFYWRCRLDTINCFRHHGFEQGTIFPVTGISGG